MSLLVLDSESVPNPLVEDLQSIGAAFQRVSDVDVAHELCADGSSDVMVTVDQALAARFSEEFPSVAVVLAVPTIPDAGAILAAMRSGIADIWLEHDTPQELETRLASIRRRAKASSAELRARVSRYESELKRDQRAGRYIQTGMLPPSPMLIDDYRLQHHMVPSHMLSGDFVDYFAFAEKHFAAYVADVSGHGASSAFVTVWLKNFSRRVRREYQPQMLRDPGKILQWLNVELLEQHIDKHAAIVLILADLARHRFVIVNAGHYPPAILIQNGSASFLETKGKPVGLFPKVQFETTEVSLDVGDRLVVFSDGVLELIEAATFEEREQRLKDAALGADHPLGVWQLLGLDPEQTGPDDMTCLFISREP